MQTCMRDRSANSSPHRVFFTLHGERVGEPPEGFAVSLVPAVVGEPPEGFTRYMHDRPS